MRDLRIGKKKPAIFDALIAIAAEVYWAAHYSTSQRADARGAIIDECRYEAGRRAFRQRRPLFRA